MTKALWRRDSGFSDVRIGPEPVTILGFITKAASTYAIVARESGSLTEVKIHELETRT